MSKASQSVFAPGVASVRRSWRPFVLIQGAAIGVAVLYYQWPAMQHAAETAARVKAEGGFVFSALSTAFAGAVLPEIAKRITLQKSKPSIRDFLFQCTLFATVGLCVDVNYHLLNAIFGTGAAWKVIAKVVVDMSVFSTCVSIPISTTGLIFRDSAFNLLETRRRLREGEFRRRYWPVMVTCWAFWIPVLTAVYAMPPQLQFCLYLCAQAAWSLLLLGVETIDSKSASLGAAPALRSEDCGVGFAPHD